MMDNIQQTSREIIDEARLDAIDEMLNEFDIDKLLSYIKIQRNELRATLQLYETIKWNEDLSIKPLAIIRNKLKLEGHNLYQIGLEGYYFIEKVKEKFANQKFTYTLGTISQKRGQVSLERVDNITLRDFINFLSKEFGRTRAEAGAQAILSGRISLTQLRKLPRVCNITEEQALLFQRMWVHGLEIGIKRGIIFEAFEHALADGLDKKTTNIYKIKKITFQKYFSKASGNVPFFTFHGDVNGAQVKFGGFTLAHINTIYGVLEYIYVLLAAIKTNKKGLQKKLINTIFKGTSAQSIEKRFRKIVEDIIDQELNELINQLDFST